MDVAVGLSMNGQWVQRGSAAPYLQEASLHGIHNEELDLVEVHEGDHLGQGRDPHGGVGLGQLLQQPQHSHLLDGLGILTQIGFLQVRQKA